MKRFNSLVLVTLLVVVSIMGCSAAKEFGEEITLTETTNIKDILTSPNRYTGKTAKVEGKIVEECPVGGWFYLRDATGIIYVDLHPSNFAIPQSVGKVVAAQGEVVSRKGRVEIIGKGVELK